MNLDLVKRISVSLLTVTAGVLIAFKIKEMMDKAKLSAPTASTPTK